MMRRTIFIAACFAAGLFGANAPIRQATVSGQAAFRYSRPDTTACAWEVSTSADLSAPISGAGGTDSAVQGTRWFVLGSGTTLNGSTTYYWRQTCGAEIHTGQFTTPAAVSANATQTVVSSGGTILSNKMTVEYGPTPDLGSSVTVECAPHCAATLSVTKGTLVFWKPTYLNDADVVASGSLQVFEVH